jgi:hypothetical protein
MSHEALAIMGGLLGIIEGAQFALILFLVRLSVSQARDIATIKVRVETHLACNGRCP